MTTYYNQLTVAGRQLTLTTGEPGMDLEISRSIHVSEPELTRIICNSDTPCLFQHRATTDGHIIRFGHISRGEYYEEYFFMYHPSFYHFISTSATPVRSATQVRVEKPNPHPICWKKFGF